MTKVDYRQNLYANFLVDGDKSITIRAILLASIASGKSKITNALIAEDTLSAIECGRALGATIIVNGNEILITGAKKIANNITFDCGNSATLARLLIGLLSGAGVHACITGDESLCLRPMGRVCEPLRLRGANLIDTNGCLPVNILPAKLCEYDYKMAVDSAQVKSALILSGVTAGVKTVIQERNETRDHTEKILPLFGASVITNDNLITVNSAGLTGCDIAVPNDPSSAAYYLALGLLLGEVTVKGVLLSVARDGFFNKLKSAGANLVYESESKVDFGSVANITAYKSKLNYFEVQANEIAKLVDEIPLLCAVALLNNGCKIYGAGELKIKESDRLVSTLALIEKAGGKAEINGEDLTVYPISLGQDFDYESSDHRMEMTAFVLMTAIKGGRLKRKSAQISFPNFYKNYYETSLGLIGRDLTKSLSGQIHKYILDALGVENFSYECLSLAEEDFDDFFKKCPYKAVNATIPYKKRLLGSARLRSFTSETCYSANYFTEGVCYTTDGDGLVLALEYAGIDLANKSVLIYGAGGAGRSIALAFSESGATVYLDNRTRVKAVEFCEDRDFVSLYNGDKFDIFVNATAVSNNLFFDEESGRKLEYIVDINYAKESKIIEFAKNNGVNYCDGSAMLFFQAYLCDLILTKEKTNKQFAFKLYDGYRKKYENRSN